jgi:anti-sigma28 factor (negative regulator of flagellin synthesis)
MKMNDHSLSSGGYGAASRMQRTLRAGTAAHSGEASTKGATIGDDLHLPELVRSLRSLASESPERQAKLEELARMYAAGTYTVDATAIAAKIIDDAIGK